MSHFVSSEYEPYFPIPFSALPSFALRASLHWILQDWVTSRGDALYCVALYCALLYCAVLLCAVLHSVVWRWGVLCSHAFCWFPLTWVGLRVRNSSEYSNHLELVASFVLNCWIPLFSYDRDISSSSFCLFLEWFEVSGAVKGGHWFPSFWK